MKVRQHLWFRQDMESAIEFYTSLIPGSTIGWVSNILTSDPNGPAGSAKFAGFTLADHPYMGFEAGPFDCSDHNSLITIECETQVEADCLQIALAEDGSEEADNRVRDAWGVTWQFTVRQRDDRIDVPAEPSHVGTVDLAETTCIVA
jgi:predicted 3-demethylubiquinone-9 3-methyltransferase (glyoxalase superfamily)